MVPRSPRLTALLLCCLGIAVAALFLPISPLTGTAEEPAELSVASFERLETGCAEDVVTYASSKHGGGSHARVSFIETGNESAELAARTERTSPVGADLTTFRVYVEPTGEPRENASCTMGVQYRLELSHDRGSSGGILSGDDGTRVVWLENGEYIGCSSSTSGSLESECHRFMKERQADHDWTSTGAA